MLIDADMFLVKPFGTRSYMRGSAFSSSTTPLIDGKLYDIVHLAAMTRLDHDELVKPGYDDNSISLIREVDLRYGFEFHCDANFIHYLAGEGAIGRNIRHNM